MDLSTKIGIGLGTLVSVIGVLHSDYEMIEEKPLETIAACAVIIGLTTGAAKLGKYVSDNTLGKYMIKCREKDMERYNIKK